MHVYPPSTHPGFLISTLHCAISRLFPLFLRTLHDIMEEIHLSCVIFLLRLLENFLRSLLLVLWAYMIPLR